MAAVFTADSEGLRSIHRKAVGVVCGPAQQNQEEHSKVNQHTSMMSALESPTVKITVDCNFPLFDVMMPVIVFHVGVMLGLLCPPSHQNRSTSFDLTSECASQDQTTQDPDRLST